MSCTDSCLGQPNSPYKCLSKHDFCWKLSVTPVWTAHCLQNLRNTCATVFLSEWFYVLYDGLRRTATRVLVFVSQKRHTVKLPIVQLFSFREISPQLAFLQEDTAVRPFTEIEIIHRLMLVSVRLISSIKCTGSRAPHNHVYIINANNTHDPQNSNFRP